MTCNAGTSTFRLQANGGETDITASARNINICIATQTLDRLHREFTEKYEPVPASGQTLAAGKTVISTDKQSNPTFYLRKQPTLATFPSATGSGTETAGSSINRLYNILKAQKTHDDPLYRRAVHAITYGVDNPTITKDAYLNPPTGDVASPTDFSTSANFKGIHGLKKLNNLLETSIDAAIGGMNTGTERSASDTADISKYIQRQGVKNTLEEIARRENEIYREKFFSIILIVVGIFLVSTQLVQKYFSFGGGSSGSSGGFGFGSGNLFTGFGLGSGSGLFSRFGGLGLGRSGRSRVTGSLFSNNPYSLSNR
jgi:hypothetical protein